MKAKVGFGKVDRVPPNAGGGKHKRVVAETVFEDGEKERFERLLCTTPAVAKSPAASTRNVPGLCGFPGLWA